MKTIHGFSIHSYGWQELARLYSPTLTPASAAKRLASWVNLSDALVAALIAAGWRKGLRTLTPLQVEIIVRFLGEP